MTGNVWEWTSDYFRPQHSRGAAPEGAAMSPVAPCCVPRNPVVAQPGSDPASAIPRKVIKGGSRLCAPNYCLRGSGRPSR
jgi:formylglycine-generating enzyme